MSKPTARQFVERGAALLDVYFGSPEWDETIAQAIAGHVFNIRDGTYCILGRLFYKEANLNPISRWDVPFTNGYVVGNKTLQAWAAEHKSELEKIDGRYTPETYGFMEYEGFTRLDTWHIVSFTSLQRAWIRLIRERILARQEAALTRGASSP